MIAALGGLVGCYIGLGAAIGRRTYQRTGSVLEMVRTQQALLATKRDPRGVLLTDCLPDQHPHYPHWMSVAALVKDGAGLARAVSTMRLKLIGQNRPIFRPMLDLVFTT